MKQSVKRKFRTVFDRFKKAKYIYLLLLPAFAFYIIFNYIPIYGIQIAFQDFFPKLGVSNSPFVGWENFRTVFAEKEFWRAFSNTLLISFGKIAFGFVFSLLTALLINELRYKRSKKVIQTVLTFPHFLSWVIIAGFVGNLFTSTGSINNLISAMGGTKVDFLSNRVFFLVLIFASEVWKEAGWGSIIYLATMAGIDGEQYEAAELDGANRFQRIVHVTLPGVRSAAILLLILSVGGILNAGFDQIFNLYNPLVYDVSDILDTYIYRTTFGTSLAANPGIGAAVGLFKSIISFALVLLVDRIAKLTGERGII